MPRMTWQEEQEAAKEFADFLNNQFVRNAERAVELTALTQAESTDTAETTTEN